VESFTEDKKPLRLSGREAPPVDESPEVVDRPRLAAAPVADEGDAHEDRGSKLLPLGADVQTPALVAV
jgi:hypothetical protein